MFCLPLHQNEQGIEAKKFNFYAVFALECVLCSESPFFLLKLCLYHYQ